MKTEEEKLTEKFNTDVNEDEVNKKTEEEENREEFESIIHGHHHASLAAEAQTEMLKHYPFTS